jgi:3-hydroxy-3-methylglutaryl CoA synthase
VTSILGYDTYIPRYRLRRADVAAALGASASGERSVAGYDEDSTTIGVAAALPVVSGRERAPRSLWFATTDPVYADKSNATTVHSALGLESAIPAIDLGASLRSGFAALRGAARDQGLAVLADRRGGSVGGADERGGADGGAAFLFGAGGESALAEIVAEASVTAEFLDRWRAPGSAEAASWEERFGELRYAELAGDVLTQLTASGIDLTEISRFGVAGSNARAVRTVTAAIAARTAAEAGGGDLVDRVGYAGAAHLGLVLADLLDTARPGELLLLVSLADGADAVLVRTGPGARPGHERTVRSQLDGGVPINYPQYLLWRQRIHGERPRRPEPERPSAPFAWRDRQYKLAMVGGRCRHCGAVQYPLPPVCYRCHTAGEFAPVSAGHQRARVVACTVDRLAYSPSPPLVSAIVAFDHGGRLQSELTDVVGEVHVGDEVALTFRTAGVVDGIHNYVWKTRPIGPSLPDSEEPNNGPAQPQ